MNDTQINVAAALVTFFDATPAHAPMHSPNETGPATDCNEKSGLLLLFILFGSAILSSVSVSFVCKCDK